jgi:hypothetical protein
VDVISCYVWAKFSGILHCPQAYFEENQVRVAILVLHVSVSGYVRVRVRAFVLAHSPRGNR